MSSKTTLVEAYLNKIPSLDHEIFYYPANKISQRERKKADKLLSKLIILMYICAMRKVKEHNCLPVVNFSWFLSLFSNLKCQHFISVFCKIIKFCNVLTMQFSPNIMLILHMICTCTVSINADLNL